MKHKTESIIIISCAIVVAFAMAAIVLSSIVLFSGTTATAREHLTVGSLDVDFYRTSLFGRNSDGEFTDDSRIDLNASKDKLFRIENFCPTDWQTATFESVNNGKVPVNLSVSVSCMKTTVTTGIAEQIKITVTSASSKQSFALGSPPDCVSIGKVKSGGKTEFSIRVELSDRADNNAAMGLFVSFDVFLTATQTGAESI